MTKKATSIYPFSIFEITKQNKTGSKMGSSFSGEHIAGNYKHTDRIYKLSNHNKSIALERSVIYITGE